LFARAALEEEVVQQVELEIAAREHVRARPWIVPRVDGQRALAAGDEAVLVPRVGGVLERRVHRVGVALH
jgi:hypothetical protein